MEVIPAINCHLNETECVKEKVKTAEMLDGWVHLDITDGRFTYNKTWNSSEEWRKIGTGLDLEVHLMVEDPLEAAREWLLVGAKRVIVHLEVLNLDLADRVISLIKQYKAEPVLAFNPETRVGSNPEIESRFLSFLVLCVHPGLAGQNFLPLNLEKISALREKYPQAAIEVDGGINNITGKLAKEAGANILISASYIFESKNPQASYAELVSL